MPFVDWQMQGVELVNCSCEWGCPCQFNALPSHGHCRALTFVQVERGRYGDVPLDGLRWGMLAAWPGPIHFGGGTFQAIVDERADARQRKALEAIAQGRDTEPGTLIWQIFSTTISTVLPTLARPIQLDIDLGCTNGVAVRARCDRRLGGGDQEPEDRGATPGPRHAAERVRVHRKPNSPAAGRSPTAPFRSSSATRTPIWRASTGPRTAWCDRAVVSEPTTLERALRHDPRLAVGFLVILSLAAGGGWARWRGTCTGRCRARRPG